ncbi:gamma-glutamyltranspeptidase/glutathione hydrolase [Spinactinospora alkalitolerans]|uniref:Gamma-glutamyltranspeptidase/glutathione hydrolase n=1 Tax=Spinactinospora alkalitolerans TaxID=687207 RepID=A0A852TYU6_9ACTN|nr:gamma-glutamyltransferase [Spinactinospora alkalitolerans]NYE47963.1 gamma-glutamyltranspeptidase/glutathione hydrolase [Spinactinospora alkalitolerans]
MVAAGHPSVSMAGARVLADGGNAVDAVLVMAAVSWLVLPGQCGIGGDAFALYRGPDGRVTSFGGSGYGPDGAGTGFYRELGLTAIPLSGALAVAVPGAVAAIAALHRAGASRPLAELWAPVATMAETGVPCTAKTHDDVSQHAESLARDPDAARAFLPGGRPVRTGQRVLHPALAQTLRRLADDPACLYRGELGERAVALLTAAGAPFSGAEWEAGADVSGEPSITAEYGGLLVHQTPPPTPGWMVLQQAGICADRLGSLPWLGSDAVHWLASAARTSFADRARAGSDTPFWRTLLEPESLRVRRERIENGTAPRPGAMDIDGDTTSMVAVDGAGRAVGLIHSLAHTFGARLSVPGTGIMLNNRLGRGAYLAEGHPNAVAPRRRPLHTLNAWLVTDDVGELRHIGNVPGGDGQVQWNTQLLSHLIDHGTDPYTAVSAPRFTVFPGSDADVLEQAPELRCESRLDPSVLRRLHDLGHPVRRVGAWGAGGSAQVVSLDAATGALLGGSDPRQDGVAIGV